MLQILSESPLNDVVAIISHRAPQDFLRHCVIIDQTGNFQPSLTGAVPTRVLKPPVSSAICVIDRTADVMFAASEIVTVQLAYNGNSRYTPTIILVNEFVADRLAKAIIENLGRKDGAKSSHNVNMKGLESKGSSSSSLNGTEGKNKIKSKVIGSTSTTKVLEILER